jgi:osmoprotectant transport system permease protein
MASGPVIPDFGRGSSCVRDNGLFCWGWVKDNWSDTLQPALLQHIALTVIAVAIGTVIAFTLALAAHRRGWIATPVVAITGLLYTIPSLALFQLLVPLTGLSRTTAEVALVSYTLLILFRNMLAGLSGVPGEVRDAARGMGMTERQLLWKVELPLALPLIFGGIRTAAVYVIATATLGSVAGADTLGNVIVDQATYHLSGVIGASICVAVLALLFELLFAGLQRAVTPRGLRKHRRRTPAEAGTTVVGTAAAETV